MDLTVYELYDNWTDQYFQEIADNSIRTITSA